MSEIYGLSSYSNNSVYVQVALDVFSGQLNGTPVGESWRPPLITVLGRSKKLKDFIGFTILEPAVSHHAKLALEPLVRDCCEFLPLIKFERTQYYALNVTTVVDCLDRERSEILYSSKDSSRILSVSEYYFVEGMVPISPMFKTYPGDFIFVKKSFVECVIENQLTNACFFDPSVNLVPLTYRGEDINVVPGLPK
jgi:hypothetical protein